MRLLANEDVKQAVVATQETGDFGGEGVQGATPFEGPT
jgi:hypothetical protein